MQPFPPYDAAVDLFHAAGGATISAIRSPHKLLDQYRAAFPAESARDLQYRGAPIEAADSQDYVSVRGTSTAGTDLEWPAP